MFYTTIARWGYAELSLLLPDAMPYVNESLQKIQIPTHNNWSQYSLNRYADTASDSLDKIESAIDDFRDFVEEHKQNNHRHI